MRKTSPSQEMAVTPVAAECTTVMPELLCTYTASGQRDTDLFPHGKLKQILISQIKAETAESPLCTQGVSLAAALEGRDVQRRGLPL